jgi:hypothetical protein
LKSLTFCNDGISKEAAAAIAEILPAPQNLQKLHFFNNMSGTALIVFLPTVGPIGWRTLRIFDACDQ